MPSLQARLKDLTANRKRGWQAALARHCGVAPASVADWVSGKTKKLDGENLLRAASFFGVNPDWLASGKGPRNTAEAANWGTHAAAPAPAAYLPATSSISIDRWVNQFRELIAPHREAVRMSTLTLLTEVARDPENLTLAQQTAHDIGRLLGEPGNGKRPGSILLDRRKVSRP